MKTTVMMAILFVSMAAYTDNCTAQDSTNNSTQSKRSAALSQKGVDRVTKEVRHALVMLPYYGVFDNLLY